MEQYKLIAGIKIRKKYQKDTVKVKIALARFKEARMTLTKVTITGKRTEF